MIKGMTGFGSASFVFGKIKGVLEVKSINHRFFDLVYYLPVGFASVEEKIRKIVNAKMKRGRITISLKITEKPVRQVLFNHDVIKQYLQQSKDLQKKFSLVGHLSLADLVGLPGVVETEELMVSSDLIWPVIEKSLQQAINVLISMRIREGKSIKKDAMTILKKMIAEIKNIQKQSQSLCVVKKKELSIEEFSAFQKSNDVNEEIIRLQHYISEFKNLLDSAITVGKQLDFVAQEMQRESNTIGSKVQDKIVANAVINIKSGIEKLREQAQNIE